MTTWSELLSSRLDLPFLSSTDDAVPFGLPPVPGDGWQAGDLEEVDGRWLLTARTEDGLEAEYFFEFFPDTGAVECWGEIANRGTATVHGVTQSLTLDTPLRLSSEFAQPWIRSINGVEPIPTYFPPYDFAPVDRQIVLPKPYDFLPITLSSAPNGRTSEGDLPCAIIGSENGTGGLSFMLEWSGLWSISFLHGPTLGDPNPGTFDIRVQIGIWGLALDLEPGRSIPLPRLLIAGYRGDLDAGGNALRRHIRRHVMPTLGGAEIVPPTSFNHWFAFTNKFTAELLMPAVDAAAAAGLEYFCVDGGWFAGDFRDGIGNWDTPDPAKFPDGIEPFAEYVRSKGMKYGTWFEPEWAHTDSELYLAHPDWFWPTPPQPPFDPKSHPSDSNVAMMNFGLPAVQDWWVERFSRAYEDWGMRWVRWDFNQPPRPNWDDVPEGQVGWRQIEHVQGLYATLDRIMAACPELFIEQCASGGHRIELGMVRRGHSFWMNDVTYQSDLVRGLQHGLNLVLPGNYANTNLCQPQRHDFTEYDFLSHAAGGFGYSGRLWEAPQEDFDRFAAAIGEYKEYRHLLLGDYSRPTGQPRRADEYAKVVFSDQGESVTMEFNHDGPGTARLERG